jgi:hypothetical protein
MTLAAQVATASIKHLLAIEDARTRQLKAIHGTVQAHLEQAYNAGREHLGLASAPGVDDDVRLRHVRLAEERFIQAVGAFQPFEPLQCSWACVHLAGICHLEDRRVETVSWVTRAHMEAVRAVRDECQRANDRIEGKVSKRLKLTGEKTGQAPRAAAFGGMAAITGGGIALGMVVLPAAVLAAGGVVGYQRYQARASAARLQELSDFVEQVSALGQALGAPVAPRHAVVMGATESGIPRYSYSVAARPLGPGHRGSAAA